MKRLCLPGLLAALCLCNPAGALELPLVQGARLQMPATSLKEIRFRSTLRQQYDFSCGSAALATLLSYHYQHPTSEQAVFEEMYLNGDQARIRREGFSMLDMQRYLSTRGFKADGFTLPLAKLIEARLPAIVLITDKGYHHFVVIKGAASGRVLLGDPSRGLRAMSVPAFEAIWVGQLLFVVHGFPGQAQFNALAEWRAAPAAPLTSALWRDSPAPFTIDKLGPGDF